MNVLSRSTYLHALLIACAVIMVSNILLAMTIDPFKVFGLFEVNQRNFGPNTRFLKIEHLKKNPHNGFIIGTSRSNGYSARLASKLTGLNFYNMNAPSETPYNSYLKLKWLLNRQSVETIILALDFDQFDAPVNRDPYDLLRQEHPAVSQNFPPLFLWKYIWATPRQYALAVYGNFFMDDTWYRFDITTGHFLFPLYDQMMKDDPEGYVAWRFAKRDKFKKFVPNQQQMFYFRKIIELARRHRVAVVTIINPLNQILYSSFDQSLYNQWRNEIISIAGSAWDFSGSNEVTKRNQNYYEISHFRREVGDLILRKVFSSKKFGTFDQTGFGTLFTH